jgi:hypothetical protein
MRRFDKKSGMIAAFAALVLVAVTGVNPVAPLVASIMPPKFRGSSGGF